MPIRTSASKIFAKLLAVNRRAIMQTNTKWYIFLNRKYTNPKQFSIALVVEVSKLSPLI